MKNKKITKKPKSHQKWSWILMITFIALSIIDYRFGILAVLCMTAPMYHALRGRGKAHCSYYCPRGSLLATFLKNVSLQNNMPKWAKTKQVKNGMLTLMVTLLTISLYHANHEGFNLMRTGFALFRFMTASLAVGILIGVIFKPRSWCQVCPMGHASGLIDKAVKTKDKKVKQGLVAIDLNKAK